MGEGRCVDGPSVSLIGLSIAAATLVCFFSMTFDLYKIFIRKKLFVQCKLLPMDAFTMKVLAVATKIPPDLTTSMPKDEDQLSKLIGTALLCTSLGFYLLAAGTMGTSERYKNLAALNVVITMVVNVCIQMGTSVIFAFTIEHIIIIMVCILILLLLM